MDQALDNRLDSRTSRRTLVLFTTTLVLAVLASPLFAIYELFIGALGLVATGLVARLRDGTGTMTATVVFAGVLAGSLPYLAAAPFVS
ncbi:MULTISPECIES: hypothetical protein [unclassified Streptomyces]|uniref:Uncharacterized protein n=1 Tax=Streptomyces millisiae TaxID=3075542 RepID=A0ABU2LY48_9ACTN|nr:hypothetical protein [Streptomyces sp. DSM 44918]MDT0322524.1 hypothetical protein [Streptomyces sp. DSM 44918]